MHALRHSGLLGIVRRRRPPRITSNGGRGGELGVIVGAIPIADPFPHVSADVVKTVVVRLKAAYGSYADLAVGARIAIREMALVRIPEPLIALRELVAPRKDFSRDTAASRKLSLRFGRQALSGPPRIGEAVLVGDVHDRLAVLTFDRAVGTERVAPARARHVPPPLQ